MPIHGVKEVVRRIRLFEWDSADAPSAVNWRWVAILSATLFLNFAFCFEHGLDIVGFGPLALDVAVVGFAAVLITLLFFLGPALAVVSTRRPVLSLLDDSIGVLPTMVVRLCCVVFLSLWIAKLIAVPALWAVRVPLGVGSRIKLGLIVAALASFLLLTALQSTRTVVKLALFSNKLGIAILLAALIRVRDGWSSLPDGFFQIVGLYPHALRLTSGLAELGAYAAPLGLFAAEYALRISNRKQAALSVGVGVTLPMFLALSLSAAVGVATASSSLYQPSLNPTLAMALWAHAAGSALPSRMFVATITTFGVLRFGFRSLATYGPSSAPHRVKLLAGAVAVIALALLGPYPLAPASTNIMEICAKCLAVTGAVLSADAVSRCKRPTTRSRFDLVGVLALTAGVATALLLPQHYLWAEGKWWFPWLLPSYLMAFLACFAGRYVQQSLQPPRR